MPNHIARLLARVLPEAPRQPVPASPAAPAPVLKPYTVVRDWDADWFDEGCDEIRCTDSPQVFHVWAENACDASDEAEDQARERFTAEQTYYLHATAVLHGHAYLVNDGE
ncbi:hypothetical protein H9W91_07415 [Streptomyces alfalfae]|uniref:hypothetical protein n=1 Tax=Streptomyces alfalfae TaxID=1642299 RepID=UPI001BA65054|nr:hypothetical protein [Streptomyces alfalfae]QUI30707.1 hypothetical protein H9W91_07415 [Streptomyces alfalfae]